MTLHENLWGCNDHSSRFINHWDVFNEIDLLCIKVGLSSKLPGQNILAVNGWRKLKQIHISNYHPVGVLKRPHFSFLVVIDFAESRHFTFKKSPGSWWPSGRRPLRAQEGPPAELC